MLTFVAPFEVSFNLARKQAFRCSCPIEAEAVFCRDPNDPVTTDGVAPFGDDWLSKRSQSEKRNVTSMFPAGCELLFGVREVVLPVQYPNFATVSIDSTNEREFVPRLHEENNPWE
jgi:hypothetical protein